MDGLIKRVEMLEGRVVLFVQCHHQLQDNKEADMCGSFMNVMEGVADALRDINEVVALIIDNEQNIKTLEPEQLKERLDAVDDYLKEIDCVLDDSVEDDDYDDLLTELDDMDDMDSDKIDAVNALPSAPTTVIVEPAKQEPEKKEEKRVAVMEEQLCIVCFRDDFDNYGSFVCGRK